MPDVNLLMRMTVLVIIRHMQR